MFDISNGALFVTDMINYIAEYDSVTLANIKARALKYVNTPRRIAQNSCHMYEAIMASIAPDIHKNILVDIDNTKINVMMYHQYICHNYETLR